MSFVDKFLNFDLERTTYKEIYYLSLWWVNTYIG